MTLLGLAVELRKVEQAILTKPDDNSVVLELAPKHGLPKGALGHQSVEASEKLGIHRGFCLFGRETRGVRDAGGG